MKKYFINTGNRKEGPFSAEELIQKNISRETMIWTSQYADWVQAGDVPELVVLMKDIPPSVKTFGTDTKISAEERAKENKANLSALFWTVVILGVIALVIVLIRN